MARVKRFAADIQVTDELLRIGANVEAEAKRRLDEQLAEEVRGPRGGRYVLFGDTEYLGKAQLNEDFIRNVWTFRARRMGRYVRPER